MIVYARLCTIRRRQDIALGLLNRCIGCIFLGLRVLNLKKCFSSNFRTHVLYYLEICLVDSAFPATTDLSFYRSVRAILSRSTVLSFQSNNGDTVDKLSTPMSRCLADSQRLGIERFKTANYRSQFNGHYNSWSRRGLWAKRET